MIKDSSGKIIKKAIKKEDTGPAVDSTGRKIIAPAKEEKTK